MGEKIQVTQLKIRGGNDQVTEPAVQKRVEVRGKITLLPEYYSPPKISRSTLLFYLFVSIILYLGWKMHTLGLISPKFGIGYYLGVTGGVMMLLISLYPVRKRSRAMQKIIPTKYWFKVHMGLGVLGPVLALIHADFKLGSINSRVVLGSTLLVAGSGFFGLYVYTKIHCGLYNRRIRLEELKEKYEKNTESLVSFFRYAPSLQKKFIDMEKEILTPSLTVRESFKRLVTLGIRIRWTQYTLLRKLKRVLRKKAKREGWGYEEQRRVKRVAKMYIVAHLNAAVRIVEFNFYERLFALWHVFHFPLYFLLIASGVVHVIAVHFFKG